MKIIKWFTIILICSCSNFRQKNLADEYLKKLNFFGDSLTNHFPNQEIVKKQINIQSIDTSAYYNTLSFELTFSDAKSQIDSCIKLFTTLGLNKYESSDSCLLVVNDYITKKNVGDPFLSSQSTFVENCSESKLPVPNFWFSNLATDETRCKLPKDFVLYVLDSKVGIYSKKINVNHSSMHSSLKHGYSKGIAMSKKRGIIIYWVILW